MGYTHAATGAVAYLASAPVTGHGGAEMVFGAAVAAGAAVLPDLDHPSATVARTYGPATRLVSHLVSWSAGGHRGGTHSVLAAAVVTAGAAAAAAHRHTAPGAAGVAVVVGLLLAAALLALRVPTSHDEELLIAAGVAVWAGYGPGGDLAPVLGWAVGIGYAAHLAGDALTEHGVPLGWPATRRRLGLPLLTTGGLVERWLLAPGAAAAGLLLATHHLTQPI